MNIQSAFKKLALCTAAAALLGSAPLATADSLVPQGYANGSQSFNLSIGGNVNAGGFTGTWNAQQIIFWCIELNEFFNFGNNYTDYTPAVVNNQTMTMLGQLFHEGFATALASPTNSAAFQLAIWEIVYDPTSLNVNSGTFSVLNNNGNGAAVTAAQALLAGLGNYTDNVNLILLHSGGSPGHQDFISGSIPFRPFFVPEPASIGLLGTALVALMFALRRRRPGVNAV